MELFEYLLYYCTRTFMFVLLGISYLCIVFLAYLAGYVTAAM